MLFGDGTSHGVPAQIHPITEEERCLRSMDLNKHAQSSGGGYLTINQPGAIISRVTIIPGKFMGGGRCRHSSDPFPIEGFIDLFGKCIRFRQFDHLDVLL